MLITYLLKTMKRMLKIVPFILDNSVVLDRLIVKLYFLCLLRNLLKKFQKFSTSSLLFEKNC